MALLLPDEWRLYLAAIARRLEREAAGYARWVNPELLHLTLVFLGYQPPGLLAQLSAAVKQAALSSPTFELSLGRLGSFGPPARPRVVWVEVRDPSRGLERLHRALVQALTQRAIPFDARELVPHITLGRARERSSTQAAQRMREALVAAGAIHEAPPGFHATSISLMRSILSPRGPEYVELEHFRLGGGD